jgi:hypothetical protein
MAKTPEQVYQEKIDAGVASGQLTPQQGAELSTMLSQNANARGQLGPGLRDDLNANFRLYSSQNQGSGGGGGGGGGGGTGGGSGPGNPPTQAPPPGFKWEWNGTQWTLVPLTTEPTEPTGRPGAAWQWNGTTWTRPARPGDGKPYIWDDNLGWQVDSALMQSRSNARDYLQGLFKQFGFDDADTASLMGTIEGWIQQGLADGGTEPILMKFRDTDIYKRRFAGMAELIGRGQAISEADYIQLESSYRNVMQNYGLPTTFYDTPSDYARLIGAGLSVREVEERVVAAKQSLNPLVAQELEEYYGVSQGTQMAYLLGLTDEKGVALESARTQEQIRTQGRAAQIGAAAERAGFAMDRTYAERLGGTSVGQTIDPFQMGTLAQLEGTFGQARRVANRETTLAGIDAEAYDQRDALAASFGDEQARLASERRARRERARFSGSAGAGAASLGVERNL